ncbi:MAG: glycerol-3-phosphate 1-O-acyltransferase PlsY [Rikenellaceae bacterium]
MVINILIIIAAYLLGSIPSAVWIGKKFYGIDVREHGSKNAGATNTLRVLGGKAAAVVFTMDIVKGAAAVTLSRLSSFSQSDSLYIFEIILIFAAIFGHIFPVFAGFKGGKGVATLAGATIALLPLTALTCLGCFILVLAITHYVSVGSMITGIVFPFVSYFVFGNTALPLVIYSSSVAVLLLITHRKNIKRLLNKEESKTYIFTKPKTTAK